MADLADLIQKLSFYQAGGKDPGTSNAEHFNQGYGMVQNVIGDVLKMKKAQLDAQKSKAETTKINNENTPYRDVALPLTKANATINADTTPEQRTAQDALYAKREAMGNTSLDQMKTQAQIEALNAKTNAVPERASVSGLPMEAKARAIAAGYSEGEMIPLKIWNAYKTTDPFAPVEVKRASEGVNLGKVPGNTKLVGDPALGVGGYADVKQKQNIFQDLPSQTSPTNVSGAAAQVQLAVRQGKGLIAKPGSPQQIALASSDVARAVQRSAPQLETLNGSSFANNFVTQISAISQKITANPTAADVPKLRRQIYDILTELETTSKPVVERSLNNIENIYAGNLPQNWQQIKNKELGMDFPDIPFQETAIVGPKIIYATNGSARIQSKDGGQTWGPVQ